MEVGPQGLRPGSDDLRDFEGFSEWLYDRSLGVPESARLVGVISRLSPLKGIEDFLHAAAAIAAKAEDTRFVIVGDAGS